MNEKPIEPFYAHRAKEVTDMLFDKRFLNDDLDRDTVVRLQEFIGWLMQSMCESAERTAELSAKFRDSVRARPEQKVENDRNTQRAGTGNGPG